MAMSWISSGEASAIADTDGDGAISPGEAVTLTDSNRDGMDSASEVFTAEDGNGDERSIPMQMGTLQQQSC